LVLERQVDDVHEVVQDAEVFEEPLALYDRLLLGAFQLVAVLCLIAKNELTELDENDLELVQQ
jgi:hypothetical protein